MKRTLVGLLLMFISLSSFSQSGLTQRGPYFTEWSDAGAFYGYNNRLFMSGIATGPFYTDDRKTWKKSNSQMSDAAGFIKDGDGNLFAFSFRSLVYKSTDNGDTWQQYQPIFTDGTSSSPVVFVENINRVGVAGDSVFVAHNKGLGWFKWGSPDGKAFHKFDDTFVRTIAVSGQKIVASLGDQKLNYSFDGGATWVEKSVPFDNVVGEIFIIGNKLWVNDHHAWYSEDWGDTWDKKDNGLDGFGDMDWSGDKMYAENNGIYVFSEANDQWTQVLEPNSVYGRGFVVAQDEHVFTNASANPATLNPGKFMESSNGGQSWSDVAVTGFTHDVVRDVEADSEGNVFATTSSFMLRKKKDENLFQLFTQAGYSSLVVENDIVYVGGSGVLKAYNSKTGAPVELNIPYSIDAFDSDRITKAGKYFFVSSYSSGVWRVASGEDYQSFHTGLPESSNVIRGIYASGNYVFFVNNDGVYRSDIDTPDWKKIYPESGSHDVVSLAANGNTIVISNAVSHDNGDTWNETNVKESFYDVSYRNGQFVGVTSGKIFISHDNGDTWASGMMTRGDNYLFGWATTQTDNEIYIGMVGDGIWSMTNEHLQTITEVTETEKGNGLVKVYPNPTSDEINVSAPAGSKIELIDLFGSTIENRTSNAAGTELFNVRSLSKGVYLFRINTNDQTIVRKFLKQ